MNRGFKYYFGNGMRTAAKVLYSGGGYLKYLLYYFASAIGRLIPFFGAIFWVSDIRRAKIAKREGTLTVTRAFGGVDGGNKFGATVLSVTLVILIALGGAAALCALAYGFWLFGYLLGASAAMTRPEILAAVFALPCLAGAVLFALGVGIMFAPVPYIVDSNKKVSATAVMVAATETMRRSGKFAYFLSVFVPVLVKAAYLAAAYGVLYAIVQLVSSPVLLLILCAVWILIALAVFAAFAPLFTLASDIAVTELFEDISLDPSALENRTKGVFVLKAHGCGADMNGLDGDLNRLFDAAPEPQDRKEDVRYVPPTDYEPKMGVFRESDDGAENEGSAESAESAESVEITEQDRNGQVE